MRGYRAARRRVGRGGLALLTAVALIAAPVASATASATTVKTTLAASATPALACGWWHTLGLRTDGTVLATGIRGNGRCDVSGWTDIMQIAAGEDHSVGVRADGTCLSTGDNYYGQCNVSGWSDVVQVAAGKGHTVALKADGSVVATGWNADGQCNVSGWTGIVAVAAGLRHTVGLKADGTCIATGYNYQHQCWVGNWTNVVKIACGAYHSLGLKADGTVVAVGSNSDGECNVSGWTNIVAIGGGDGSSFGVKADGAVNALGYNEYGQCNVSGWTGIVGVSAGCYHSVGWRADGTCVGAGSNSFGQSAVAGWNLIDMTPPAVTPNVSGTHGDNGWYTSDASVSLDATDGPDGTGVRSVEYSLNGGGWTAYADPLSVTDEGTTTIAYRATDNANNTSVPETVTVKVDKTPPATTSDAVASYDGEAVITLHPADGPSGVATTCFSLDSAPAQTGTALHAVTCGSHTLAFWSVDTAGNVEAAHTVTFTVDSAIIPIAGGDRYGTAIRASQIAFPDGADAAVICRGDVWADAAGGSALAGAVDAPLLLTRRDVVSDSLKIELARLHVKKLYVLGSTSAVSDAVAAAYGGTIEGTGTLTRLGGVDRYDTARLIAEETVRLYHEKGVTWDGDVFLATGEDFPDAIAVAPLAARLHRPILLTRTTSLSRATGAALATIGAESIHVLGSTRAVSAAAASQAGAVSGITSVSRIEGSDRYRTAIAVAEYGVAQGLSWNRVAVSTGVKFPDALAGGVMQGCFGSVMLLTPADKLYPDVATLLHEHRREIGFVHILGGPAAVSEDTRFAIHDALQ